MRASRPTPKPTAKIPKAKTRTARTRTARKATAPPPKAPAEAEDGEEVDSEQAAENSEELADSTEPEDGAKPNRHEAAFAHADDWGYKVFTTEFDEEIAAADLCEPEELARLRSFLDQQLSAMQGVVSRLANKLQRLLMAQQNRHWEYDLEEGMLDASRLTRIVIDPMYPLSFKREKDTTFRDTCVTLLLDNSGSMRGRPIMVARHVRRHSGPVRSNASASRPKSWASPPAPGKAARRARNGWPPASRRSRDG